MIGDLPLRDVISRDYETALEFAREYRDAQLALAKALELAGNPDCAKRERRRALRVAEILRLSWEGAGGDVGAFEKRISEWVLAVKGNTWVEDGIDSVFVETTVQWEKIVGAPEVRREVERQLVNRRSISSLFCLEEVDRCLGNYFRVFLGLVRQARNWADLHRSVGESQYLRTTFPRRAHVIMAVIEEGVLEHEVFGGPLSAEERLWAAEDIARIWLLSEIQGRFAESIDQVFESFQVPVDLEKPLDVAAGADGSPVISCNETSALCQIEKFMEWRAHEFRQVLEALGKVEDVLDSEQRRGLEVLRVVFAGSGAPNFRKARGARHCNWIADFILAIECPKEAIVLTTNCKHFEVLGRALDRKVMKFVRG